MVNLQDPHHHTRRDAETFVVLGIFLVVLAVCVLAGTFFAEVLRNMIINVIAGLILLAIGSGMIWRGRYVQRHLD